MAEAPDIVAFDVLGTIVDWHTGVTEHLRETFARRDLDTDPAAFAVAWRGRYLPALRRVNDGNRPWASLDTLHRESLDALLDEHGIGSRLDESDRRRLVGTWHRLPAWPDSAELITRLKRRSTVVALSNGSFALLVSLAKAAGLPFDGIISAEFTHTYKPAPEPYAKAAELLEVDPGEILLVAAHGWDLAGAASAGLRTAFLERPDEYGPGERTERSTDATCGLAAASAAELARRLGC
ncbi:haloacid dehalogenase type II [Nocardiopsis kunsanensis]|uniref:haloacid dehalogenase type II n=1 Tax=Nocardiopsis kunsanensis TaxID=141693 RepID=UPI000347EACB|nr:haloacid dehalogenase type II [Nocardiopsis kunsanensis]